MKSLALKSFLTLLLSPFFPTVGFAQPNCSTGNNPITVKMRYFPSSTALSNWIKMPGLGMNGAVSANNTVMEEANFADVAFKAAIEGI